MIFRPQLAATAPDLAMLRYPLLGSPKFDGVRAIKRYGTLVSRTLKAIPNGHVQELAKQIPDGWDGELIAGPPAAEDCYRVTMSAVMASGGMPDVRFFVFDVVGPEPYIEREAKLKNLGFARRVQQTWIPDADHAAEFEERQVAAGYEGIMLRDGKALYKQGRSTLAEHGLLKVKRFTDDEAVVVGFQELMRNENAATLDERGLTKRSSHQENKRGAGVLGALRCQWRGLEFGLGTGFDDRDRQEIWRNQKRYLGLKVKFRFLAVGVLELPRHPVFLGWALDR